MNPQRSRRFWFLSVALTVLSGSAVPSSFARDAVLPNAAKKLDIFRVPLGHPYSLTASEQQRAATYFGGAPFSPIIAQARRFPGTPWVAVPGRKRFSLFRMPASDLPSYAANVGRIDSGVAYSAATRGILPTMWWGCGEPEEDVQCGADGPTYASFVGIAPNRIKAIRIVGETFSSVDGLIYGTVTIGPGTARTRNDVQSELFSALQSWHRRHR